jgi:hypothetical protein
VNETWNGQAEVVSYLCLFVEESVDVGESAGGICWNRQVTRQIKIAEIKISSKYTLVEIDHHHPCPNGLVDFWVVNFVEVVVDGF